MVTANMYHVSCYEHYVSFCLIDNNACTICNRSLFHSYLIRHAIIFVVVGPNMYFKLNKIQPEAQFIDHMIKNTK